MKKFIPNTNTVNSDRQYYISGNEFIKVDSIASRGENEAYFLSILKHKYIQKIIGAYMMGFNQHCLVTEKFDGDTLENLILSKREYVTCVSQLLEVQSYLVQVGICHGDINVSNVMFNGEHILLIDWESAYFKSGVDMMLNDLVDDECGHRGIINTIKMIKYE